MRLARWLIPGNITAATACVHAMQCHGCCNRQIHTTAHRHAAGRSSIACRTFSAGLTSGPVRRCSILAHEQTGMQYPCTCRDGRILTLLFLSAIHSRLLPLPLLLTVPLQLVLMATGGVSSWQVSSTDQLHAGVNRKWHCPTFDTAEVSCSLPGWWFHQVKQPWAYKGP